jgi:hypothetical protein
VAVGPEESSCGRWPNNPSLDEDIVRLALGERDIDDLVAFLTSLTSGQW